MIRATTSAMGAIVLAAALLITRDAAAQVAPAVQPAPAAQEYRPTGYPESYSTIGRSFYPAAEMRALPVARAQAVAAKQEMRRAESALNNAVYEVRRAYTRSEELITAQAEEKAAWDALLAARDNAMKDLKQDEHYLAAQQLRDRLANQIAENRDKPGTTTERILAMARVKLNFATSATAMEIAAVSADPNVKTAQKRLIAAGNKLTRLRMDFEDTLRADARVTMARKNVEDARTATVAADAMYIEATRVADAALDFAYFVQATPMPYIVNTPDIYGGYGYNYGSYASRPAVGYPIGYPYVWTAPVRR